MRKLISILLALTLIFASDATVFASEIVNTGELGTVDTEDTVISNSGTINNNKGTVTENTETGLIKENNGTVDMNLGKVENNYGTIAELMNSVMLG